MTPLTTVEEAREAIKKFEGAPQNFMLPVADELQDAVGISMAIITDAAIAKGWQPAGFEQREGYRIYRYAALD